MDKYDRVMRKTYNFYDNPKSEETYCLTDNLVKFILPRLKLFVKESSKTINWNEESIIRGIDIIDPLNQIIEDFETYQEFSDETSSYFEHEVSQKALKNGFIKLSLVCEYLDW